MLRFVRFDARTAASFANRTRAECPAGAGVERGRVQVEEAFVRMKCLLVGVMAALVALMSTAAAAQDAPRTISQYDKEIAVSYVAAWEKGDRWGHGMIAQGGYRVWAFKGWQVQGIGEFMVARFDYFDSSFKQFVVGARAGKLMWPKVRTFAQLQAGVQNDGFNDSSTGGVVIPGVGFNYALFRQFDVQLLIDAPIAMYDSGTYNQARIGIGVALPLGSR